MPVKFEGLITEPMPSGNDRIRVRVKGNPNKKIRIYHAPDHPKFLEHYKLARLGIQPPEEAETPYNKSISGSLGWLCDEYREFIHQNILAGIASHKTLKKKDGQFRYLKNEYGDFGIIMPESLVQEIHDKKSSTPSSADDLLETIKSMYLWAKKRNHIKVSLNYEVERYNINKGGTKPWTMNDINKFKNAYPMGTTEYCAVTLFLFTACRVGDASFLGPQYEFMKNGSRWLSWVPSKKGSIPVQIPIAPQLTEAITALKVIGSSYLLTQYGKSFSSEDAISTWFRTRCTNIKLSRSAHGLRKSAGNILAELGCSNYEIMALHGHTNAKTSEVYTKGANRAILAEQAVTTLSTLKW